MHCAFGRVVPYIGKRLHMEVVNWNIIIVFFALDIGIDNSNFARMGT